MDNSPMKIFQTEAPEAAAAFGNLIESISASKGLDAKSKQLIYIAMKAVQGDAAAVIAHTAMAKNCGATREELKDAILMTLTVAGIKGVITCLPDALAVYDQSA